MRGARDGGDPEVSRGASVAESPHALPHRRRAGLLRCPRPAAGRDRLLALARPPLRAGRPGQPRPRLAAHAAAAARPGRRRHLPAGQPRPAPAGGGAGRRASRTAATRWTTSSARPTARGAGSTGCASGAGRRPHGWLLVHAGVVPQWDAARRWRWPREVEACCAAPALADFLHADVRQRAGALERRAAAAPSAGASSSTC